MSNHPEPYVKPAVLRLEFAVDVPVSLASNCKTTASPNVGSSPCRIPQQGHNCTTVGS